MSYIERINKILGKKSNIRGGREIEDEFLEWQDKEVIAPLVLLGPAAVEDMVTVFKTADSKYRTNLIRALGQMGTQNRDAKAKVITALEGLLQDKAFNSDKSIANDYVKRDIQFYLEVLKK